VETEGKQTQAFVLYNEYSHCVLQTNAWYVTGRMSKTLRHKQRLESCYQCLPTGEPVCHNNLCTLIARRTVAHV
jgi:hypothetical protein